ncbi:unnamed protein product, partial [Cercopithifilaria johnstoni]
MVGSVCNKRYNTSGVINNGEIVDKNGIEVVVVSNKNGPDGSGTAV